MTVGLPGSEGYRRTLAAIFLVLGMLMLFWAWGNYAYRLTGETGDSTVFRSDSPGTLPVREKAVRASPLFLMVGVLLFLSFLLGSFVIVRAGRRYRAMLSRKKLSPTSADDLWQSHHLRTGDDPRDDPDRER